MNATISQAIRNLYYTMKGKKAATLIAGYDIEVITDKGLQAPILIAVYDGATTLWYNASKDASKSNSLYRVSEVIAKRISAN